LDSYTSPMGLGRSLGCCQYFSVRRSPRQCGSVTVSDHFAAWAELGLELGRIYDTRVIAEGLSGSGTMDFRAARVSVGGSGW
jgi:hypothetical protein